MSLSRLDYLPQLSRRLVVTKRFHEPPKGPCRLTGYRTMDRRPAGYTHEYVRRITIRRFAFAKADYLTSLNGREATFL
jgi:hypothetical protein